MFIADFKKSASTNILVEADFLIIKNDRFETYFFNFLSQK